MAHNNHEIPWPAVASKLRYDGNHVSKITNLYPRTHRGQNKMLNRFVNAFTRALSDDSDIERTKYPSTYGRTRRMGVCDLLIDDCATRNISKTVGRFRSLQCGEEFVEQYDHRKPLCNHDFDGEIVQCHCPVMLVEREFGSYIYATGSAHLPRHSQWDLNCDIFEALVLHNEMDPILIAAAHPRSRLFPEWYNHWAKDFELEVSEWGEMLRTTLMSYICLNILYLRPETWDPARMGVVSDGCEQVAGFDYRRTRAYQLMLVRCTGYNEHSDVFTHPHRDFYGVVAGDYDYRYDKEKCGTGALKKTNDPSRPYLPINEDVGTVINLLGKKGLPAELSLQIIQEARYEARRKLPIADDPLNPANAEELAEYLNLCWALLVRGDMILKELEFDIDWKREILGCLKLLWGGQGNIQYSIMNLSSHSTGK